MTRPTERVARVRTAAFALVSALVGILLALPCFSRVPLAFTQNGPQQEGRVKITVHVLRAEGGDPLPGIRVNFLNLRTRNQGFRVSKDDGLCDAYWVPAGTRLEITPTNPRYDFGEAGSDNIMRSSLVVTANRDQDLYFKGRALGRGTPRAAESRPVEAETAIPGLAYGAEHAYVSMRNGPMPPGVTPQQWAWRILYEQAYESLVDDPPIWSLRLSLTTGTSSYAGTDSGVFIQFFLPKRQAWSKKFYLDRHQDDFRPGARAGYYLLVPEIARLSDLGSDQATMKIGLDGQDDWELTSFSLEINDKVTLLRGQGHWLRDGGNSVYVTSYRDSGYDRKQRHRGVTLPKLVDLRPRLEAMIGNQLNQPLETRDTRGSWNTHIPANEALRLTKVGDYRTRAAVFVVGRYRGEEAVRFELDFDLVIEHPRVGAPTLNVQDFRVRETWSAVSGAVRSFLNSSGYQLLRSFVDLASYPFGGAHPGTDRRVDIDGELERTRRTIEASAGLDAFKLSFDPKLDFDADLVVTEVRSRYPQIPEAMIRDFLVKEGFPSGGTYPRHLRFQDDASISVFEWPRAIDRIVSLVYNEYVPVAIPMGRAGR